MKTWNKNIKVQLQKRGFKTIALKSIEKVKDFIVNNIPGNSLVGLGASLSPDEFEIYDMLKNKGNHVFRWYDGSPGYNRSLDTFEEHPVPDYYLTLADTITEDGKLIISDFTSRPVPQKKLPKHFIAFTPAKKPLTLKKDKEETPYAVFDSRPPESDFTVVLLRS
ncbi:MAG: LUD domain-containing protein [Bacteroidales bacterium]|nr:LUD domain-containing protein [Bacteroidales bacterium]